jgi:uncharacterized membrane protein YfcA
VFIAAGVLLPLGLWLALASQRLPPARPAPTRRGRHGIWLLSLLVGTVGGIYGIGGWSILGAGGFAGSYLGARLQRHLPERTLRRLLGVVPVLLDPLELDLQRGLAIWGVFWGRIRAGG